VLLGLLLARALPTSPSTATTLGVLLVLPTWATASVAVLLVRSGPRAWAACLGATLLLGLLALALGPMPE